MKARLLRFCNGPFGCFGFLLLLDDRGVVVEHFATAEDDWDGNRRQKSAIPVGTYQCVKRVSPRFGPTFEITGVPGRSAILFHAGNTEEDTLGCVLLGERFGGLTVPDEDAPGQPLVEKWAVKESKAAFRRFRDATVGLQQFELTVEWDALGAWRDLVP